MSRKRRGFLGRDDAIGTPVDTLGTGLPEPYVPPESKESEPEEVDDPLSETDLGFDLNLPESMDEQIPGFFDWDGGDGLEEPPTEEVPTPPMDAWTEDFPAPLSIPDEPPMEGVLDGFTPAPVVFQEQGEGTEFDSFEELFELPKPPKKPVTIGGLQANRLLLILLVAILIGLGLSAILSVLLFWNKMDSDTIIIAPPSTIRIQKDMTNRSDGPKRTQRKKKPKSAPAQPLPTEGVMDVAPPKKRVKAVKPVNNKMGTVRVRLKEGQPNIDVWIDGTLYGPPPINVALAPGVHEISGVPVGKEHLKKVVDVRMIGGKETTVDFSF